jgi:hypothetical protein
MTERDFSELTDSGLLPVVEEVVLEAHRNLYLRERRPWSRPAAYHWLHYEDPAPVHRLSEGVRKLQRRGARFEAKAVDKACARAREQGFLN